MREIALSLLVALVGAGLVACESAPEPPVRALDEPAEPPPPPPDVFSAARAWEDLEALVALGPRVAGTGGGERARAYLRGRLEAAGLEVEEIATVRTVPDRGDVVLRHLAVTLPGASPQLFVLLAPYDSSDLRGFDFVGANDGASGAALLLELARVLDARSLPYTTRIVFVDGEGRIESDGDAAAVERWTGSEALAEHMEAQGELDRIRLLVALHQVCDADLRIARDLSSHRMHREEFFRAAERLGRVDAFPRDQGFESVEAGHLAFRERGVRPALALVDTRYGGDAVPGVFSETPDDTLAHCAPESLAAVGVVMLDALETIGRRLAKIDRFARTPLSGVEDVEETGEDGAGDAGGEGSAPAPGPALETGGEPAVE